MSNLNVQKGDNNKNSQGNIQGALDSSWKLIWTAVIAGVVVAAILGLWKLFLG